jgi:purine-binding chemotaxis protein CheW
MEALVRLTVFCVSGQRYALPLEAVDRALRAVEITALPQAPAIVLGVIDLAGRILPVLNLRRRLGLAERPLDPADQFLVARTARRPVALAVDAVQDVISVPTAAIVAAAQISGGLGQIQGVAKLADGLVLIHDLEKFLSLDEARALDAALNAGSPA